MGRLLIFIVQRRQQNAVVGPRISKILDQGYFFQMAGLCISTQLYFTLTSIAIRPGE